MDTTGLIFSTLIKEEAESLLEENKCAEVYRHPKKIDVFIYVCRICNKQLEKAIQFEYHILSTTCNNSSYSNDNVKCENNEDIFQICDINVGNDVDHQSTEFDNIADDYDNDSEEEEEDGEKFNVTPIPIRNGCTTTKPSKRAKNHTNLEQNKFKTKKHRDDKSLKLQKTSRILGHRLCEECNEQIPSKLFKKHKQIHNPWLYCDFCGHKSKLKGNLLQHMLSKHTEDRPYKCDLCSKTFKAHSYMDTHMRMHRKEPTDQCHLCGKAFYGTNNYREHLKQIHLNMKRSYPCKQCDKKYTKSEKLQIHIRAVHTGERPFICALCGKAFAAARYLRQHNSIHMDEKQYKCKYCGLAFAQNVGRRAHERRMHEKDFVM